MKGLIVVFLVLSLTATAQDARPVVAVLPFEAAGTDPEETKTIEGLVQSYVSELQDFRLISTADRDRVLREQEISAALSDSAKIGSLLSAHFLLAGSVGALGDDRVLTIEVIKVATGEKRSASSVHRSMSELALATRGLVQRIFAVEEESPSEDQSAEEIRADDIVGSWRGDKGIELVKVFKGGKAIAVFSSGAQMELAYRIEGGTVRFTQTSANSIRYYSPVPYPVAKELVEAAQPMEWIFRLHADATVLRGVKVSTGVRYERDRVLEILRDASRDAEWTKPSR